MLYLGVRTGFLDQAVRQAIDEGIAQIVLLGAGLDTRAARLARSGVRFFEVDHPKTQADKRARLAKLDDYPADAAAMVGCDLSTTDFVPLLRDAGFDVAAPALIVWEGVVYYLTEHAVRATLERVARAFHPDTRLFFDTVGKRFVEGRVADARELEARSLVAQMGEPLRFGVDHPLPMLFEAGFRHVVSTTFDEACLTLTGTYERERRFRFQALHEARVRYPG